MVTCGDCSRPNGADRHTCIYCGAALVDDVVVAREMAAALLPPRPRGRRGLALAVLAGQDRPAGVEAVASIFGCEHFAASQLLRRSTPLLIPCDHAPEAIALGKKLRAANLVYVTLDLSRLDEVPDAELLDSVRVAPEMLRLTTVDGPSTSLPWKEIHCVIVGRIETRTNRKVLETRTVVDRDCDLNDVRTTRTWTNDPSYDAFTLFDIYASETRRLRLVESVCTIEGVGYPKARRGAGYARFARCLAHRQPGLHIDDNYLQLGKTHRTSTFEKDGRLLAHGLLREKEVVGVEEERSGQGFDDYSVLAWTIWRLAQARA